MGLRTVPYEIGTNGPRTVRVGWIRCSLKRAIYDVPHERRGATWDPDRGRGLTRVSQRIYPGQEMTPRKRYSFWIDDEQAVGLKAVKVRDGVLESEQIRRAINDWLKKKGVKKTGRKRVMARSRP